MILQILRVLQCRERKPLMRNGKVGKPMKPRTFLAGVVVLVMAGRCVLGQEAPEDNRYVSRAEYDRLKQEIDELKSQMRALAPDGPSAHGGTIDRTETKSAILVLGLETQEPKNDKQSQQSE